ncbi:N-acetylmuramic acid 6-phosphate etherase [Streptobacillus moniliformis]|uniref:N-acetylmuramic acid 6-phosphate etherase n=2 Tax=Streptobacillus moniliformis TaxID=34105 RepID=D1AYR2_STRM9|nr:N-acetylmuramic acid 6-phosphate etherase [Streptobacillus moniliformis]ACZ01438.1 glucokinase regulatory-like protein [Streptobacillus moniliformis DSM 12112]AVL43554.1 N-acetylmuramic acid 6-phosphate etherase [Streptobacillus moniliformis]QXW66121.1 N-acetylmuramic acid 6-phosphate etherase [Streptobacillus moniliformis]SQA13400.1 N-acetylmuramic acid 6-phosphate etherase [Streptobacillus moniliformis]
MDLSTLSTEKNNENSKNIELQDSYEILKRINDEDKKVACSIEKVLPDIAKLIDAIVEKNRIIYVGAGTSGRIGVLDAVECPPTYGVDFDRVQGLIAGGREAMFEAKENSEDDTEQGSLDIKEINLTKDDVVIGIAASGRTPYVLGAINYAKEIGALTASITCSENSELSKKVDIPIEVLVGPEIITGSTRMKSATAQKMILNMISTSVMIKRGKVFSGYMVDVKTSNLKLIERAKRILMNVTSVSYEEAQMYLERSGMSVKVAIAMILLKIEKEDAENKLKEYNYNIARLIHEYIS